MSQQFTFYLIRHGQSTSNLHPELIGGNAVDPELTNLGRAQAVALGEKFLDDGVNFARMYSSSMKRAKETAKLLYNACRLFSEYQRPREAPELNEIDRGDWQGKAKHEILTQQVRVQQAVMTTHFAAPRGESQDDVADRIKRWIKEEFTRNDMYDQFGGNSNIALVMHGIAIKSLVAAITRMDSALEWQTPVGNCSVSVLRFNPERGWALLVYNDMSMQYFLPKDLNYKWSMTSSEA